MAEEVSSAFQRTIDEGEQRLKRSWPALLATGAVGGIDVGVGVFALLLVEHSTHNELLGGLAFSIGFIALALANSELFTENFFVPIAAVAAGRARAGSIAKLWAGALVTNLVGGWVIMLVVISAVPKLEATAVRSAKHYIDLGLGWESFAAAIMGGAVITLMTWMEQGSESEVGRLVAAAAAAFLLAAGKLNHAIVVSLILFAGLHAGAPYGFLDWLGVLGWASLGNLVGGVGLVTVLRLIQVGRAQLAEQRAHGDADEPEAEETP